MADPDARAQIAGADLIRGGDQAARAAQHKELARDPRGNEGEHPHQPEGDEISGQQAFALRVRDATGDFDGHKQRLRLGAAAQRGKPHEHGAPIWPDGVRHARLVSAGEHDQRRIGVRAPNPRLRLGIPLQHRAGAIDDRKGCTRRELHLGGEPIHPAKIECGKDHPANSAVIDHGLAEVDRRQARDPTDLVVADRERSRRDRPLIPGAIGSGLRRVQREAAALDHPGLVGDAQIRVPRVLGEDVRQQCAAGRPVSTQLRQARKHGQELLGGAHVLVCLARDDLGDLQRGGLHVAGCRPPLLGGRVERKCERWQQRDDDQCQQTDAQPSAGKLCHPGPLLRDASLRWTVGLGFGCVNAQTWIIYHPNGGGGPAKHEE